VNDGYTAVAVVQFGGRPLDTVGKALAQAAEWLREQEAKPFGRVSVDAITVDYNDETGGYGVSLYGAFVVEPGGVR
jgi:hypothetical protein